MPTATRIPEESVEAARNVPIGETWRRLGLPEVKEGKAFCSPFREDKNPSCQLGGNKNVYYDHATGVSHDGISLARLVKGCDFQEAVNFVLGNDTAPLAALPAPARTAARPAAGNGGGRVAKFWTDLPTVLREFEKLDPAYRDEEALRLLWDSYGLACFEVPADWRIITHKGHRGIVYRGISPDGTPCSYKYRSIDREGKGKRFAFFLAGGSGAILLDGQPGAALVLAGGEEKAAACRVAGFSALAGLTGERAPDAEWIKCILESHDGPIILANDADPASLKVNQETAQALEKAGLDPALIRVVSWPQDAPAGYDLNNHLKARGVEGLRALLNAAPAIPVPFKGEVFDVDSLFGIAVDPRENILGDHVLQAGELTVVAGQPDVGKTRVILQLCVDLLTGSPIWLQTLPIQRHDLRILMVQTENSAGRMQHDLANLLRGCSAADRRAVKEALLFTLSGGVCSPDWNLERVSALCQHFRPDLAIFDPLGDFLFDLENENAAMEMRQAVKALCRAVLAANPKAAIVVIHHAKTGRVNAAAAVGWDAGAFARGSKVLASIARAQVNLAPGDESGETVLVSCGKCNNGRRFDPFAVRLNEGGVYVPVRDFDLGAWKDAVSGRARRAGKGCAADVASIIPQGESLP